MWQKLEIIFSVLAAAPGEITPVSVTFSKIRGSTLLQTAIDKDLETLAGATSADGEESWVQFDLPRTYNINEIVIYTR